MEEQIFNYLLDNENQEIDYNRIKDNCDFFITDQDFYNMSYRLSHKYDNITRYYNNDKLVLLLKSKKESRFNDQNLYLIKCDKIQSEIDNIKEMILLMHDEIKYLNINLNNKETKRFEMYNYTIIFLIVVITVMWILLC
tara:strand:+ start:180 stop:596 length:417 start_codon:yes stop_codon:yes gene_type:complete